MAEAALSPLSRLYRAAPVLLVAGLSLIWASRPSIPVVVRGMGLMAPPGERRGIYARGAGEVQRLNVQVGDQVSPRQRRRSSHHPPTAAGPPAGHRSSV